MQTTSTPRITISGYQAVIAGLRIASIKEILTLYRVTPSQASAFHCIEQQEATKKVKRFLSRWLSRDEERWNEGRVLSIPRTGNLLTVIIPFLNEKEEVGRTVRSIRETVGDSVDIIANNDQSDDGYPYREDLAPYGVSYVYNPERKGVAASRDYGVSLCTTPYFLLLDATCVSTTLNGSTADRRARRGRPVHTLLSDPFPEKDSKRRSGQSRRKPYHIRCILPL